MLRLRASTSLAALDRPDRREFFRALGWLDARGRVDFLAWCCRRASGGGTETRVTASTGDARDVFRDLCLLSLQHGLCWDDAGRELMRRVGKHGRREHRR